MADMNKDRFIENYPDILFPEDVMTILGLGKNTIYALLKSGELRSLKIGKQYRIPKKFLMEFIDGACYDSNKCCGPPDRKGGLNDHM